MAGNNSLHGSSVASKLFAVLDAFAGGAQSLRLTDIVDRSGLAMPTALRMVRELVSWGGLERARDGSYRVGARMWLLGNASPCLRKLRELGEPHLQDLLARGRTGVHLAALDGVHALVLSRLGTGHALPSVGARLPLHATGTGRALLAFGDPALVDEVVHTGLPALTRHTVTAAAGLRRGLARVRDAGVAVVREEYRPGLTQVAAPVFHPTDGVVAAIGADLGPGAPVPRMLHAVRMAAARMGESVAAEAARQADAPLPARRAG
ncbi:IclR family transcriptional regulator [Phytohabitans kaempferiae]|uniref:IclR family transcriptional regulator n=1 Tax=Phytohabitans kaempferiae TaxID=1620943 RepID=A0ABV6M9V6_9ACTN